MSTIETKIPARLDRLPWSRFHWMVVIGLGTVWILDGLEVTIVGSIAARLTEEDSGLGLSPSQVLTAGSIYVSGACLGALFFGQLTDRFGRKKLFLVTLVLYLVATVATAFAGSALYFYIARFFTGAGIGGEYAAINSAIDELIPARVRGRVDLIINGSYWLGAAAGALGSLILLDTSIFAPDVGWRLAFLIGAVLGVGILVVRRHVPESPRWLFIHGQDDEAERIVGGIEDEVRSETGQELEEPGDAITVRQRKTISFREIASTAFKDYPRRTALGLALFVGQAFIYNAVTFGLGTFLVEFYDIESGRVPVYIALFAFSNFLGPLLLGRLFDTVGRKPMIAGTYLGSAVGPVRADRVVRRRLARALGLHGAAAGDLLPGERRRELCLPDRVGDLPDGDPRARDRVLLRDRDGSRRHHRPVPVRQDDRVRLRVAGGDRVLHRGGRDGDRRHRRARARGQGRGRAARGHRHAAVGEEATRSSPGMAVSAPVADGRVRARGGGDLARRG